MTDWQPIEAAETLTFRCKTHTASIRMVEVDDGWSWAIDYQRRFGDHLGHGEPLGRRGGHIDPARLAPSRDAALDAASAHIRSRIDDRPILEWLDGLAGTQPDLFGVPA